LLLQVLRRNVLIFHAGALGDFVLTWPLALALSRLQPQSRIIYVAAGQKGKLAEKAIRTESLDIESGWHHLFGAPESLPEDARKTLGNAHAIYTFVASPGDPWSNSVLAIAPEAQLVHIQPRPPENSPFAGHITQWMIDQLATVPIIKTGVDQIMRSIVARGVGYKRSPAGAICVHPGGGAEAKRWPSKHYVQLVRKLVKGRHHVRVLIGEVEREQLPKEDLDHFAAVAELVEPKTYVELLDNLGTADALVCNDTGPGHLAGIIGTPTFSLFGPASNPDRWRPVGPHVHVKQADDLNHLAVDDVAKWVSAAL
jgi:ADP-heptose:LPS heptosyltransferase